MNASGFHVASICHVTWRSVPMRFFFFYDKHILTSATWNYDFIWSVFLYASTHVLVIKFQQTPLETIGVFMSVFMILVILNKDHEIKGKSIPVITHWKQSQWRRNNSFKDLWNYSIQRSETFQPFHGKTFTCISPSGLSSGKFIQR